MSKNDKYLGRLVIFTNDEGKRQKGMLTYNRGDVGDPGRVAPMKKGKDGRWLFAWQSGLKIAEDGYGFDPAGMIHEVTVYDDDVKGLNYSVEVEDDEIVIKSKTFDARTPNDETEDLNFG
jgi:hypothetical protein